MLAPPRISGRPLQHIAQLSRTKLGAQLVFRLFKGDLKLDALAALPDAAFGEFPVDARPLAGRPPRAVVSQGLPIPAAPWSGNSAAYTSAYREGRATPREVAERAVAGARALAERRPSVGPMLEIVPLEEIRREAEASRARWAASDPRSPLDGVPLVVKEESAVRGLRRQSGSDFEDPSPCAADSAVVARLRAAGMIVLGTTPMTEYGMTPLGTNPKRSMPRNPHASDRVAGGSSTGSGVAVAVGVAPLAVACDGGGSIRVPSALNGVFGIKPTFGRVSRAGDSTGGSVAHVGPIASSTLDLARFLDWAAGPDPDDPQTFGAPPVTPGSFEGALARGVRGLRIAVDQAEWRDADPAVADAGLAALVALEKEGAVLVDVTLDLARAAAPIGYLTIGLEDRSMKRSSWTLRGGDYNPDLQITYAALGELDALEYVFAQRLRSGLRRDVAKMFGQVDLFAMPTTRTTAAKVTDAEFASGFVDARALDALCRFNFLGNLTGLPAASAPVGTDGAGLPIGLQLVGDAWDEATVLAACAHLERIGAARVTRPGASASVFAP